LKIHGATSKYILKRAVEDLLPHEIIYRKKMGKLVYTSPSGVKVWSGPRDEWLANILLQSARASIKDPPGKELTGYLLETPAGTFPALAINGKVSEKELHSLIDSLVPAK